VATVTIRLRIAGVKLNCTAVYGSYRSFWLAPQRVGSALLSHDISGIPSIALAELQLKREIDAVGEITETAIVPDWRGNQEGTTGEMESLTVCCIGPYN
jgi:hypothetical protein